MQSQFLFSAPGGTEWIIILVVVIVLFGGRKIPELMKGIGKGVKEFKDAKEGSGEVKESAATKE